MVEGCIFSVYAATGTCDFRARAGCTPSRVPRRPTELDYCSGTTGGSGSFEFFPAAICLVWCLPVK